MKHWVSCAALALTAAVALSAVHLAGRLPPQTQGLIEEKYAGWSGVLRVWVCEGWENGSGTFSGWLDRCISRFEKTHAGVYVQTKTVDESVMRAWRTSGVRAPDMLLFAPGMLDSSDGLCSVSGNVREPLKSAGSDHAVPVAMGGYAWAVNHTALTEIPRDMTELRAASLSEEDWRCWPAAVLALCSGAASSDAPGEVHLPGVDLGLTGKAARTPQPNVRTLKPCTLAEDFSFDAGALKRFANGELDAIPVTVREIAYLSRLSERGRGPDWSVALSGSFAFSDQLLLLAVADAEDEDAAARRELCMEFLNTLLQPECQKALSSCGAFSVTDEPTGYAAGDPLAEIDAFLRDTKLYVPSAFSANWRQQWRNAAQTYLSTGEYPNVLVRELLN